MANCKVPPKLYLNKTGVFVGMGIWQMHGFTRPSVDSMVLVFMGYMVGI